MWEVDGGHGKSYASYIVFRGVEEKGFAKLIKASANPRITDGNKCYTLSGAVYGVYSDAACTVQQMQTEIQIHWSLRKGSIM